MIVSRSFSLCVSSTLSHTSSIVNISSAQHVSWLSLFLEQLRVMSHFRPSTILPTFFRFRNSYLDSISDSESFRFKFKINVLTEPTWAKLSISSSVVALLSSNRCPGSECFALRACQLPEAWFGAELFGGLFNNLLGSHVLPTDSTTRLVCHTQADLQVADVKCSWNSLVS